MQLNIGICVLCYLVVTASAQFMDPRDVMVDEQQAPIGESVCITYIYVHSGT